MKRVLFLTWSGLLLATIVYFIQSGKEDSKFLTNPADASYPQQDASPEAPPSLPAGVPPAAAPIGAPQGHPLWPDDPVLKIAEYPTDRPDQIRRVTLIQPKKLPYPVRVEEKVSLDGKGQELIKRRIEMVANRVLVRIRPESKAAFLTMAGENGLEVEQISRIGIYRVQLPEVTPEAVPEALELLESMDELLTYAEADSIVRQSATPNDPDYLNGSLWGMHNTGQDGGTPDADIDAPEAWEIRTDSSDVIIGVIDSGVRYTHEDIAANMWVNPGEDGLDEFGNSRRANGVDDDGNGWVDDVHGIDPLDSDGDPMDQLGHGTHVAGTIAGVGNNGLGVTGVTWKARIMALRFLNNGGSTSDAIICLEYAINNGASITNNSWGGPVFNQSLFDILAVANNEGMLAVTAAGNDSDDIDNYNQYPANFELENILAVAATDRNDELAFFSNFGPAKVEIAAPGVAIQSLGIENDSDYLSSQGTSMASPAVAGAAALVAAEFPDSDPVGIKNRLLASARQVPELAGAVSTGAVLNLEGALLTVSDAPYNDSFAKAAFVPNDPSVLRGTTRHATDQAGEPMHAGVGNRSIWYKWVATNSGTTLASTSGSDFDTVLAVYSGTSVSSLQLIDANDDFEDASYSRTQWESVAGNVYFIAVAGKGDETGTVRITISGPPAGDSLADAVEVTKLPLSYSSDNTNASREAFEPLHAGMTGGGSLWIKMTLAGSSRNVVLDTRNSNFDTLLAVYESDVSSPSMSDLRLVAANDDGPYDDTFSELSFMAAQDRTYWIVADGKNGDRGTLRLRGFPQQANDNFASAIGLSGNSASYSIPKQSLHYATRESGEPNHANRNGENSLWWFWSPDTAGDYLVTVDDAIALGIYVGDTLESLKSVASSRQETVFSSRAVVHNAQPGTRYFIALDSIPEISFSPEINLSIRPEQIVPNNSWRDAISLEGVASEESPISIEGSNLDASLESGEPNANLVKSTVWYRWTAPAGGEYTVDTHFSEAVATVYVYETNGDPAWFNEFTLISPGDQNGVYNDAWARFTAVAGKTYYFQVGSPTVDDAGEFRLTLKPFQRPANDDLEDAEVITNFFVQREIPNFGATREVNEPLHETDNDYHNGADVVTEVAKANKTLWFKWTAEASTARRTSASAFGSNMVSIVAVYEGPAEGATFADLVPLAGASSHWSTWWAWGEFNWEAEAGKTYYIALGAQLEGKEEIHRFSFWQNTNDNFADRKVLSGDNISETTANFAATFEAGEPVHIPRYPAGRSLWYEWTAPETGTYILDTIHSFLKDRFVDEGLNPEMNKSGGRMQMAVYTGTSLGNLTRIASNKGISIRSYDAMIALDATAGTTYHIALDSEVGPTAFVDGPKTEWCFRSVIRFNISRRALENDNLADAKEISGDYYQEFIDLKYASREQGEPSHGGRSSRSAWWKWTAPDTGFYHLGTASDIFDSEDNRTPGIAAYSSKIPNPSFADLINEAEANNGQYTANYIPAQASFYAIQGQEYYFAVDLDSAGTGSHKGFKSGILLAKAPGNDDFSSAYEIRGSHRRVHGHNLGATEESGEPDIEPGWKKEGATNSSVWWKWTAPASGLTTVDTVGSFINAELGVYTGPQIGQLFEIAREETGTFFDNGSTYDERAELAHREVTFQAEAGITYYILVNGSSWEKESRGPITLTVKGQPGKPLTPTGLAATRLSAARVELSWTDEAVDEDNYLIERAINPEGPWQEVYASGLADVTTWTDLNATGALIYRIRAEGPGGVSDWALVFVGSSKTTTALEAWREVYFGTVSNKGVSADTADPDNDSSVNKLEFALGTNPVHPDREGHLPVSWVERDGDTLYLYYSHARRTGTSTGSTLTGYTVDGITYVLESTTTLAEPGWLSGPSVFEEPTQPVNNGDGTETVTVRARQPVNEFGPFVRLLVE